MTQLVKELADERQKAVGRQTDDESCVVRPGIPV